MQALIYVPLTLLVVAGAWAEEEEAAAEASSPSEQDTRIFSTDPALASDGQVVGVSSTHGALLHITPAQGLVNILNKGQSYPGRYPGHGHPQPGGYPGHGHPGHGGSYPGHGHPGHGGSYPGHGHPGHGGSYPGHGHPGHGGSYPGHGHPGHGGSHPGHGHPGHGGSYPDHGHPGHGGSYPGHGHPGHGGGHGSPCQDHTPSRPVVSCKYFCKTPCGELVCCEDSNNPYTTTQRPVVRQGKCPPPRPVCLDSLRLKPPSPCAHDGYCSNYRDKCCWDACLKFYTCKLAENYYGK